MYIGGQPPPPPNSIFFQKMTFLNIVPMVLADVPSPIGIVWDHFETFETLSESIRGYTVKWWPQRPWREH